MPKARTAKKPKSSPRKIRAKKRSGWARDIVKFWLEILKDTIAIVTGFLALLGLGAATTARTEPVQPQQQQQQSTLPQEQQREVFAPRPFGVLPPEIEKVIAQLVLQLQLGVNPEEARAVALRALGQLEGTMLVTEKDLRNAMQHIDKIVKSYKPKQTGGNPYRVV